MRFWGLVLVLIAITAGIFISSMKSVSLLKGSHVVYNISSNSVDVNCSACHKHVAEEMAITRALHGPHWDLSCVTCHRFNGTGISFATANSSGVFPGKQAHAAYIPSCLDCHGGNGAWVYNVSGVLVHAPPARAFNITTTVDYRNWTVISSIPYYAAHKQFIAYCENVLHDENLACLACHTNFSINITYKYHYNISYSLSLWTFTSFNPNWSRIYTVHFVKNATFSGKHIFLPTKDINCSKCHENIYLGLINGTHAPIYYAWRWGTTNLWGDPRYHALALYGTTINTSWINDSYCDECHNLYRYATVDNPAANLTYNLLPAALEINSTKIHCAEKVSCITCHGYGKPYDAYNATSNTGHEDMINYTATNYSRLYHGDICMACHEAAVHGVASCGKTCHAGNAAFNIYSEPSGADSFI